MLLGAVTAMVVGGAVTATAVIAAAVHSGSSAPDTSIPKSQRPANINPNKSPVLDQSKIKTDITVPLTVQQEIDQATAWAAQDQNSRLVCFKADGSVASMALLDRIDPASPLPPAAATEFCNRAAPGSHP